MVSKGQFVGPDWNLIMRLHSQVMTGTHELTNCIALSHETISRCSQPTSKVGILRIKQQHDIKFMDTSEKNKICMVLTYIN